MSAVEYVVIFTSIVLGLALSSILVNFDRLLRAGRRVRWHWAAPVTAVLVVLLLIQVWWSLFPDQAGAVSTIGAFLPQLGLLILLFLLASASLPAEVPDEGLSLGAWYDRNGPYFWTLMTLSMLWTIGTHLAEVILGHTAMTDFLANRQMDFLVVALFGSLIVVRRRWWHAVVIAAAMAGPVGWLSRTIG